MSPQDSDLEDRVKRIEDLIGHVLARAEQHPVGRRILALLGLR
jgi:hypothetical protein